MMAPKAKAAAAAKQQGVKHDQVTKKEKTNQDATTMDPKVVTKMLNFLRYRADPSTNKKGDGLGEAQSAMAK